MDWQKRILIERNGRQRLLKTICLSLGLALLLFTSWGASGSLAQESSTLLFGTILEAPAAPDGIGSWRFQEEEGAIYTLTVDANTYFESGVPSVGERVYIEGTLLGADTIQVFFFAPEFMEAGNDTTSLETDWLAIVGQVVTAPADASGLGEWQIQDSETSTLYVVIASTQTLFSQGVPAVEQTVLFSGFLQPDGLVVAAEIEQLSTGDSSQSAQDGTDMITLSGVVTSISTREDGGELWAIRTDTNLRVVSVDGDTTFYPARPAVNDPVHVWGIVDAGGQFLAMEIAQDTFETGEIVIRLANNVISQTVASRYNLIAQSTVLASGDIYQFMSPDPHASYVEEIVAVMDSDPDIVWAEPNYVGTIPTEGQPYSIWSWGGSDPDEYINQAAFEQVNLAAVHEDYRGDGVVIAVLDTGIDRSHPSLQAHLLPGWDMLGDDSDPSEEGRGVAYGHGTHISGIIARVAPNSKILPVRVLDSNGRGDTFILAYAIEWAVDHGADVINLSLGAKDYSWVLDNAVQEALAQGVIVVAAAGNGRTDAERYPAADLDVIAVSAVDANGVRADFANYGSWVDIAAPGLGIKSTLIGPQGSGYGAWDGTSMATPFVSGAAALLRQQNPGISSYSVSNILQDYSVDITQLNPEKSVGGLLNIAGSLSEYGVEEMPQQVDWFEQSAEAIGISSDALYEALGRGASVAGVADAHSVAHQGIIDAILDQERATMTMAVAQGYLTQAEVDAWLIALPELAANFVENSERFSHISLLEGTDWLATTASFFQMDIGTFCLTLEAYQSIADLADVYGYDRQTMIDMIVQTEHEIMRVRVANEPLTQASADSWLNEIDTFIAQFIDTGFFEAGFFETDLPDNKNRGIGIYRDHQDSCLSPSIRVSLQKNIRAKILVGGQENVSGYQIFLPIATR